MKIKTLAVINRVIYWICVILAAPFALVSKLLYLPAKGIDWILTRIGNWLYVISDERNDGTIADEEIKNSRYMNAFTANHWLNKEKMPL